MTEEPAKCNGLIVVLVEDEPVIRDLTADELIDSGYSVVAFPSGEEALPYLSRHGRDLALVITDVQMPGNVSGLELAEALNRMWPRLKVLVTSGGPLVNPNRLPPSARFMPKPWRPAELAARVRSMALASAA